VIVVSFKGWGIDAVYVVHESLV